MKVVWVVVCLAASLAGVGVACGPQEKYCLGQHLSCTEATIQEKQKYNMQVNTMSDAGIGDTIVIE